MVELEGLSWAGVMDCNCGIVGFGYNRGYATD